VTISFGLDADRVGARDPIGKALHRRVTGRYPVDPFGLDPQVCDLIAPVVNAMVRVRVEHPERIPATGAAAIVSNRGLGVGEPTALAVAVRAAAKRRLRVVGAPSLFFLGNLARRLGAVNTGPEDLSSVLRAGHLIAVPLSPTWLRTGAGTPPLELVQAMIGYPVLPVAVRAAGPFGAPTAWHVHVGNAVTVDSTYHAGDPLAAAELGETVRAAVSAMLAGEDPPATEPARAAAW
jgi:hypothetical protein